MRIPKIVCFWLIASLLFWGSCAGKPKNIADSGQSELSEASNAEFIYINNTGKFIPKDELAKCLAVDIPNYDRDKNAPIGIELENGTGEMAGSTLYSKGMVDRSPAKPSFMVMLLDAEDHVEKVKSWSTFKVIRATNGLIYAEYRTKQPRLISLILVKNRLLIEFIQMQASEGELSKVVENYDLSCVENLAGSK